METPTGSLTHTPINLIYIVNGVSFQPKNATAKAEALVKLNASIEPVRKLAPDMGSYMNEVSSAVNWMPWILEGLARKKAD